MKRPKMSRKAIICGWSEKRKAGDERVVLTVEISVDSNFGTPGAILVMNSCHREFFLEKLVVEGFLSGGVHFGCHSWVQPSSNNLEKIVFFSNTVSDHSFLLQLN